MNTATKLAKNQDVDQETVKIAGLLYNVGMDNAFEYLYQLNMPLNKVEKICNCINPSLPDTESAEKEIVSKAIMIYGLEKIKE